MPYTYSRKTIIGATLVEYFFWFVSPLLSWWDAQKSAGSRILLVEPFQMGDVLSLTPMFDPLKRRYPLSEIFVLTKPSSGAILLSDPRVKVLFADFPWSDYGAKNMPLSRLWRLLQFVWRIRRQKFDIGIDTRGDIRSQVVMVLAGCKRRIGFTRYLGSNLSTRGLLLTDAIRQSSRTHRYEANVELLTHMGIPKESLLPLTFPSFHPEVNNIPLPSSAFILVHIGGGWEFKRWATEKWVNLVDSLSKDTPVVVISGPGEAGILSELSSKLSLPNSVTCKVTTFEEMIALTIGCSIFIGLDSGPMNLATCLNKKVVALFGPGEFNMWRPLTEGSRVVRRVERFPCSPCLQITCLYPHHNCMAEIQVEDVMNAIVQTLDSPGKQT